MTFWLTFISVILVAALVDVIWVVYLIQVEKRHAAFAGLFASLIMGASGYTVINYIEDYRYLAAAFIGAFIGTYVTVKYFKK